MVEFALLLPIFLVIMFIIADFGVGISRWVIVTNATREGARLAAVGASVTDIRIKVAETSNGLLEATQDDVKVNYVDKNGGDQGDRGDSVVVEGFYDYQMITPLSALLSLAFNSISFHSCTDMRLELPVTPADNPNGVDRC